MSPYDILKKYWGYDSFRPKQLEIIESIIGGHDTLGLMPTGGGKSITFQVPALMLPGITIVVTPLISLMKDQVDNLKMRGVKAAMLYSGMTRRERHIAYDKARLGVIKLLYVSPERLRSETFRTELRSWNVSLIVVDEAHCISQWGYDFRPPYLRIAELRDFYPQAPILALTASATPVVRDDIVSSLRFSPGYRIFALSFHRDNLSYVMRYDRDKEGKLVESLRAVDGSAIVYVRSRKATARYAELLQTEGISATFYHAGLDPKVKEERQQLWKENKIRVMVATNAFGMGIDKPDVRVVVHMDVPPSLEEYYQEAGRAGRDGRRSYALMIATPRDKATLTRRLNAAFPPKEQILQIYDKACVFMDVPVGEGFNHAYDFDIEKFCNIFGFNADDVRGALNILNNAGYLEYNDDPVTRPRIQIIIRREEFYHLRLEDNEHNVVNTILRLYPGLFADYVNVDEEAIAVSAQLTTDEVYQTLLTLKRKKILDYIPKRIMPYIFLPTSRELPKHVVIGRNVYEDRRALMEQRINAIRSFVFGTDKCRDMVLLEYFGENEPEPCGMCDVCVSARQSSREVDVKSYVLDKLKSAEAISMGEVMRGLPNHKDRVVEVLRELLAAKVIVRRGNNLYLNPITR